MASGTAFATIAASQMANAFACRSTTRPAWRMIRVRNRLVLVAVAAELVLLLAFPGMAGPCRVTGWRMALVAGWGAATAGAIVLVAVDALAKTAGRRGLRLSADVSPRHLSTFRRSPSPSRTGTEVTGESDLADRS